mgnify:CR=1 FL=1
MQLFLADINEDGIRFIYDKDGKSFRVDEDTLVFVRAPVTRRKSWSDLLTQLERENICCVNNRHCMESTSDKYRTSLILAEQELNQPKSILVHHQDKALDAFDRLGAKFPDIIKPLTGSVAFGVVKIAREESINASTQIMHKIKNIISDDAICLLHTIGSVDSPTPVAPWIQKRIFPGGIVPSLSELVNPIEKTGLVIADCETLIHHYDKTLKAWLERFLENKNRARSLYDKDFCRMWEFYLASCSAAFKFRDLVVYQLQLVKNFTAPPSNRRNYIYQ